MTCLTGSHILADTPSRIVGWGIDAYYTTPPEGADYVAIATGELHYLALKSDGKAVAWGLNEYGEGIVPSGTTFKAIDGGYYYSVGLRTNGSIVTWGRNTTEFMAAPAGSDFIAISAGPSHCLALKSDGSVVSWGYNDDGRANPPPDNTNFRAISAGAGHNVGLKQNGSIVTWGNDDSRQVSDTPTGSGFLAIAAGDFYSLAIRANGTLVAWGQESVLVTDVPTGSGFVAIAAGSGHCLALKADGTVVGWGTGVWGETQPPSGLKATAIVAGFQYSLALELPSLDPPVPVITSPSNGSAYYVLQGVDSAVPVHVDVAGDPSQVVRMTLFRDGNQDQMTTGPWPWIINLPFDLYDLGSHQVQVVLTRTDNSSATSDIARFWVLEGCFLENVINRIFRLLGQQNMGEPVAGALNGGLRERIFATASDILDLDLDLFRNFRDEVLADIPAGRYYTDLYETLSISLTEAALANLDQIPAMHQALLDWTPAIQALVAGKGETETVTPAMATQAQTILTNLRAVATGDLAAAMDAETAALDPATWSGKTIGELLDRVEARTRPAPTITTHPATQSVAAGDPLTLSIEGEGAGPITYQWYRDGVPISGATGPTFTLPSAQSFHAGAITATVSNPFGETASNAAALEVQAPPPSDARLVNLSTRAQTLTKSDVLIPGFVLSGSEPKRILARVVGPRLVDFGVAGAVIDPVMTLKKSIGQGSVVVSTNDNWSDAPNKTDIIQTTASAGAFELIEGSADAAMLLDLEPGRYTVLAEGKAATTGVTIVEIYDVDSASTGTRLINISTRGFVGAGAAIMIPGYVVAEGTVSSLLVRAVGPTLGSFNITGFLEDPQIQVFRKESDGTSTLIAANDDWAVSPAITAAIGSAAQTAGAFALVEGTKDSAMILTLLPGVYTVKASGVGGATGTALVEVYELP